MSWSCSAGESFARRSRKRKISATAGRNSEVDSMWRAATPTVVVSMMIAVRWGECPRVGQNVSGIGLHSRKHRVFVLNPCELEARARLSPKWGVPSPCCCAVWGVQNIFVCNPERWNKAFASNHRLQPLNEPKQSNSTRSEMKKFHTFCPEFFSRKNKISQIDWPSRRFRASFTLFALFYTFCSALYTFCSGSHVWLDPLFDLFSIASMV